MFYCYVHNWFSKDGSCPECPPKVETATKVDFPDSEKFLEEEYKKIKAEHSHKCEWLTSEDNKPFCGICGLSPFHGIAKQARNEAFEEAARIAEYQIKEKGGDPEHVIDLIREKIKP